MSQLAKISSKGQVTIPADVRKNCILKPAIPWRGKLKRMAAFGCAV